MFYDLYIWLKQINWKLKLEALPFVQGASTITWVFAEALKGTRKVLGAKEHRLEVEMLLIVYVTGVKEIDKDVIG